MTTDEQIAFRFDARAGELWRDGMEAKLTPHTAAVLALLAERAQKLVLKQELFDHVWGGLAVSDDALISCIQELRRALGDDARRPRYIETRHRRGYRLMTPAAPVNDAAKLAAAPFAPPSGSSRLDEMEGLKKRFGLARAG